MLEQATGYRPSPSERIYRWTQRHPTALYFGAIATVTVLLLALLFEVVLDAAHWRPDRRPLLTLMPANEIGITSSISLSRC